MADILRIHQLQAEAVIGVYEHEKLAPQPLIFDIELEIDSKLAAAGDDIGLALDYHALSKELVDRVAASRFELIETLVNDVADWLYKSYPCQHLSVRLFKPNALSSAASVSISVNRP